MFRFFERHSAARWRVALLAMALPLVVAAGVFIWQDYQARRDAMVLQVCLKSALVNAQLEDFVHTVRGAGGVFAEGWVNRNGPGVGNRVSLDAQNAQLSDFVSDRPHFSRAFITDTTGRVRVSSDPSIHHDIVGGEALYRQAVSTGAFTVSDVVTREGEDSPFALFVQPLSWPAGPQEFLVLQSELDEISGALDMSIGFPSSAKSGIFDSQGKLLAGTGFEAPHPGMVAGKDISDSEIWAQALTHPTTEWFGPGLDGVDRIIFFGYPDSTPWVTTVAYAQSELMAPLWQRLWTFGGVLAATLVAVVWVGEVLVRRERRGLDAVEKERVTLEAVMSGASDGIMVIGTDNRVAFANRRSAEMFGLEADNLIGQSLDVVQGVMAAQTSDPPTMAIQLSAAMRADDGVVADTLRINDSIGIQLEVTSYALRHSTGREPRGAPWCSTT